jgi:putative protein-disulfide isomerase
MVSARYNVRYLMDPLCGWCYGAAPALQKLRNVPGVQLEIAPTGLFAGAGSRAMDGDFAAFAWSNDERIERLTGQRFTPRYRSQVLDKHGQRFDSGPATLALTAVQRTAPEREFDALRVIQEARYVDGLDTTDQTVLAGLLRGLQLDVAAEQLLQADAALATATQARVADAQRDMQQLGAQGVPNLVLVNAQGRHLVRGNALYGSLDSLLAQLQTS